MPPDSRRVYTACPSCRRSVTVIWDAQDEPVPTTTTHVSTGTPVASGPGISSTGKPGNCACAEDVSARNRLAMYTNNFRYRTLISYSFSWSADPENPVGSTWKLDPKLPGLLRGEVVARGDPW